MIFEMKMKINKKGKKKKKTKKRDKKDDFELKKKGNFRKKNDAKR